MKNVINRCFAGSERSESRSLRCGVFLIPGLMYSGTFEKPTRSSSEQ